jgi:hypothetical protein
MEFPLMGVRLSSTGSYMKVAFASSADASTTAIWGRPVIFLSQSWYFRLTGGATNELLVGTGGVEL